MSSLFLPQGIPSVGSWVERTALGHVILQDPGQQLSYGLECLAFKGSLGHHHSSQPKGRKGTEEHSGRSSDRPGLEAALIIPIPILSRDLRSRSKPNHLF